MRIKGPIENIPPCKRKRKRVLDVNRFSYYICLDNQIFFRNGIIKFVSGQGSGKGTGECFDLPDCVGRF
jgi:hypothetical protein